MCLNFMLTLFSSTLSKPNRFQLIQEVNSVQRYVPLSIGHRITLWFQKGLSDEN